MNKNVYIIVLNWNGTEDTIECLKSLKNIYYTNYTIILVDNGSTSSNHKDLMNWCKTNFQQFIVYSRQIAEKGGLSKSEKLLNNTKASEKILVIENNENLGFAAGNNVALKYLLSKNDNSYALLLNNDTIVEPDFLNNLNYFMENNKTYVACTPKICLEDNKNIIWNCGGKITWFGNRKYFFAGSDISETPIKGFTDITYITGCALLFRPHLTGILSETFFFGEEDFELSLRLKKEKKKIACVNTSLIYHKVGSTIDKSNKNIINKSFLFYVSRLIDHKSYYKSPLLQFYRFLNLSYAFLLIAFKYNNGLIKGTKIIFKINKFIKTNDNVSRDDFLEIMNMD